MNKFRLGRPTYSKRMISTNYKVGYTVLYLQNIEYKTKLISYSIRKRMRSSHQVDHRSQILEEEWRVEVKTEAERSVWIWKFNVHVHCWKVCIRSELTADRLANTTNNNYLSLVCLHQKSLHLFYYFCNIKLKKN